MGCGASTSNPPLTATKMRLISEMAEDKRRACEQVFDRLDKDGNGSITLEDSIWAKPFLDAHDIDGDGRVTLNEYLYACCRRLRDDADWNPTESDLELRRGAMGTDGKYLVLGLADAGKRTLLQQLAIGEVQKSEDGKVTSLEYKGVQLHAWNLGGKDYRGDLGYEEETEGVTGIIFMVDSAGGGERQTAYPKVHKHFFQMLETDWCQKLSNLKVMVLANKQDYRDASTIGEVTHELDLESVEKRYPHIQFSIQGCSVKVGNGIFEAFTWLTQ